MEWDVAIYLVVVTRKYIRGAFILEDRYEHPATAMHIPQQPRTSRNNHAHPVIAT